MSIIQTLDYSKILNFMPCNAGSGNDVATEGGATITQAATPPTWITTNGGGVQFNVNESIAALDSGAWQDPASGSDLYVMWLVYFDGLITNFYIGSSSAGHNFHFSGGGQFGIEGSNGLGTTSTLGGASANLSLTKGAQMRVLYKCKYGEYWDVWSIAAGTDLSSAAGSRIPWSVCGETTDFRDFSTTALFGGDELQLYGMQWIEFPNGFVDETAELREINRLFTQWEAGNKEHFQILA